MQNTRAFLPVGVALMLAQVLSGQTNSTRDRPSVDQNIATLVSRLDLERYKATIKSLTAFGDRRQGTRRNREAVDWIDAQLRSDRKSTRLNSSHRT